MDKSPNLAQGMQRAGLLNQFYAQGIGVTKGIVQETVAASFFVKTSRTPPKGCT